ncbi:2Fe-2S iron-sulfur cluster-binding protein [Spirosoma pollinicola]|uniref:Ferredoxin n=1 Tax=Spirosoma pollinicola TaxID=2057025 RepID=A0A2K8YV79_9BACT|nr:2Fe-2S iron-sulfur cluster-binding protein [Spirosoma pollinicola]AUD01468.1 ferredoxin [Spirosoma pollinicola]
MISFTVEDRNGERQPIEIPEGINLSLMEVLKASDYTILATCGGLAICATCHVQVLNGLDALPEPQDAELDMLDTLPDADSDSRLSCQIRIDETVDGAIFRIKSEEPI